MNDTLVIDQSVQAYAVMLNRPSWLDPARKDLQRKVWQHLIAGTKHGRIIVDDVMTAIKAMMLTTSPQDILPSAIIEHAADMGARRARRVDLLIRVMESDHRDNLLIEQEERYKRIVQSDPALAASQLADDIAGIRNDLELDGRLEAIDLAKFISVMVGIEHRIVHGPLTIELVPADG